MHDARSLRWTRQESKKRHPHYPSPVMHQRLDLGQRIPPSTEVQPAPTNTVIGTCLSSNPPPHHHNLPLACPPPPKSRRRDWQGSRPGAPFTRRQDVPRELRAPPLTRADRPVNWSVCNPWVYLAKVACHLHHARTLTTLAWWRVPAFFHLGTLQMWQLLPHVRPFTMQGVVCSPRLYLSILSHGVVSRQSASGASTGRPSIPR